MAQQAPQGASAAPERAPIEEILITARKRVERAQDASVATQVLSNDRLSSNFINDIKDLQTLVPTLTVSDGFGIARLSMRGVGNTSTFSGEDPSVIVNVDGAVISRPEVALTSLFDLERIEVVRGPQGTLYGRNATGGAINLITAKPTDEVEGYVRVTGGRFEAVQTEGAVSGPLSDTIRARFAWKTDRRNGFGKNNFTGNGDIDNRDRIAFRAIFDFDISEDVDFMLTSEYWRQDDSGSVVKFRREGFPGATAPNLVALGIGGFASNPRDFDSEFDPREDKETWSITGILDWRLNDQFSIRSVTNFREYERQAANDLDISSIINGADLNGNPSTVNNADSDGEQYSEDLQLHFDGDVADRRLIGVAGFFYFQEDNDARITIGNTPTSGVAGGPPRVRLFGDSDARVAAVYWNVSYELLPDLLTLRGGGRFNHEHRETDNRGLIRVANGTGPLIILEDVASDSVRNFNEYTNEVGVDFRLDSILNGVGEGLVYFTFAEGFQSGAGLLGQLDTPIIDPVAVDSYEAGIKTQWFDRRLTINLTGFTGTSKGIQLEQTLPSTTDPRGFIQTFRNATALDFKGLELDVFLQPNDSMRFSASAAYLDAEFRDFTSIDPTDPTQAFVQLAGNRPARSPKWKFNVHGEYDLPATIMPERVGTLTVQGDVSYIGSQFFREFNTDAFGEDEYALVDASITYTSPGGRWTAQLWGKNLTDQERTTFVNFASVSRTLGQDLTPPLTWGVSLGHRF